MATNPDSIPDWVRELCAPKFRNPHDLFKTAEDLGMPAQYVDMAGGIGWVVIPVPDTDATLWLGWADPSYVGLDLHTDPDFDMQSHVEDMLAFLPDEDPTMFSVGRACDFRPTEVTEGWVVMAQIMVPEWCECGSIDCGRDNGRWGTGTDDYHSQQICISWGSALYGQDYDDWSDLLPFFATIARQHAGDRCEFGPRHAAWLTRPGRNPFAVP